MSKIKRKILIDVETTEDGKRCSPMCHFAMGAYCDLFGKRIYKGEYRYAERLKECIDADVNSINSSD